MALLRRIYRPEFADALGVSQPWFRVLEERGTIPPGRVDPNGRRRWWFEHEANAVLKQMGDAASTEKGAAPPRPTKKKRRTAQGRKAR